MAQLQVKTFSAESLDQLDAKVNHWLQLFSGQVKVTNSQAELQVDKSRFQGNGAATFMTRTIWYEEVISTGKE